MITIQLPDGSTRQYSQALSVQAFAKEMSPRLAKVAIAAKIDGKLVDTSCLITKDCEVRMITSNDPEGVQIIRHSTAHLMAHAVKRLFPMAQVTIGPVIEDGFYYDFAFERPFTPEDLTQIEAIMQQLAKAEITIMRREMTREAAIAFFQAQQESYKVQIIKEIPAGEVLSFYQQDDFTDLCRGPHTPHTGFLQHFKLMKLAGAYWRGDSRNEMLQRIYGTAWGNKTDLKAYLHRLEEAEKRDHRKLAKVMDLFHFQAEAPGMVFWHDHGWRLYQTIEQYMRQQLRGHGYQEIKTPQLADRSLWERSGHIAMYSDAMFSAESSHHRFAIKPMSCPCHVQVFNHGLRSYRDLPLRMAEFGACHRNEPSGTLHGLMRVQGFVQDDAHIFCTEKDIQSEGAQFIQLLQKVYRDFGFSEVLVDLSTRPPKRVGDDALWDRAESALAQAIIHSGLKYKENPGDGAFYGPKIDFSLKDCLGRVWQCGTLQLDYCLPERLGASYIAEDGSKQTPVMLHRAILGSFERFIGILIEHYAGKFPVWLAPIQAVILNITDKQAEYSQQLFENLQKQGLRVQQDLRNEKIGFKIREHTLRKIPYFLIIGPQEVETQTISLRAHNGGNLGTMNVIEFVQTFKNLVESTTLTQASPYG